MRIGAALFVIIVVVLGFVANMSLFTVHQTQQALVLQFGNPVRVEQTPGLKVKMPFVQNVEFYDNRILDLDPPAQEIILKDQKRVNVDAFARYKIIDPLEYKKTAKTNANFLNVFGQRLNSAIRAEIGKILLGDMLTDKRAQIMAEIATQMKINAKAFGVEVIDVRIGRTDLPQDTAQSVYNRMRSDRIASAAQIRAVGEQQKLRIESEADRERTVILAEAQRLSEILRGEGEGERNLILVTAQNQDPEFFAFYRSMEAYGAALTDGTTWVLSPDSEFFRYFNEVPVQSAQ
ncbi:MAG: protease modulator HflC [Rhodospirillales bacterium]|jgi:modulator of FtsH protease HflC|nr:protease modulator HflC [Rhodospirillales bacterium]MBT4041438.1 protease modulator HflC [Rhodospirillales bacterium]MBT4627721.1 protease modulator HflC [Rhodospirillales bacterium]MBT5352279.1 protease modulator HflC [Rhodospirillales bacterium]MBT6109704.1 protease modulator HflC [Rhodospirillales bacterium]